MTKKEGSFKWLSVLRMLILLFFIFSFTACTRGKNPPLTTYTLTFVSEGKTIDTITAKEGEVITLPQNPTKADYDFLGWCLDIEAEGEVVDIPTIMPAENRTYYAKFALTIKPVDGYKVSFFANAPSGVNVNNTMEPLNVAKGTTFVIPECDFEIDGYMFAGWVASANDKADLTQGEFIVGHEYLPTDDTNLYACWLKGYVDREGSTDIIYAGSSVVGLGSAVLDRDGMDKKLGFAEIDQETGNVVGFTFYFDESEGGDIIGVIATNVFYYRGEEYGMYVFKDYVFNLTGEYILYLDGYGEATYNTMVGDQLKSIYGKYAKNLEYGDYDFYEIDPITGQPIIEDDMIKDFNFSLLYGKVDEFETSEDAPIKGYYFVLGLESGSYLLYENGKVKYDKLLELNGYGYAKLYEVTNYNDDEPVKNLIAEGRYSGSENYYDFQGEWHFATNNLSFNFILTALEMQTNQNETTFLPVYLVYDDEHSGIFNQTDGDGMLEFDGYSGATYTSLLGEYSGVALIDGNLCTLYVYDEDGYISDTLYFSINWQSKTFSLFNDGFIIENGVLVAYTGTSKAIVIPNGVTEIKDEVFKNMDLESVVIPASVIKIGNNAFQNNYTLTRVTFLGDNPSAISIDWHVANDPFRWPAGNFVIVVPELSKDNFVDVWSKAWQEATGDMNKYRIKGSEEINKLPEFEVTEDGVLIGYHGKTDGLIDLTIGVGQTEYNGQNITITAIGAGVFRAATYLQSVDLGGVTIIGEGAFENCTSLVSVAFNKVEQIGKAAFAGCTALANTNGKIELLFVKTISESAFASCSSIKHVVLGQDITDIASLAFAEVAIFENDILYIEFSESSNRPTIASYGGMGSAGGAFYGNVAYRIIVPNIDYALACYDDASWYSFNSRLMLKSAGEEGEYFDGAYSLILDGRAVAFNGSEIWLYVIEEQNITFYSYLASSTNYIIASGTFKNNTITFDYAIDGKTKQTYNFRLAGTGGVSFTSEDGVYTLLVDDPRELDPDTWSSSDKINNSFIATLNGKEVTIKMKTYRAEIENFVDEDGKHYRIYEIIFTGNTFTYKKELIEEEGLKFSANDKIENLICEDGSILNLHKLGASIYVYGEFKGLIDGIKFPAFSDYGTPCTSVEGNVITFMRPFQGTNYEITVIIDQNAGTFTYTWVKK